MNIQYWLFKDFPVKKLWKLENLNFKETHRINSTLLKSTNVCQNVIMACWQGTLDEQNLVFMRLACWQAQLTVPTPLKPANSFIFSKFSVKWEINPFKF